MKSAFLIVAGFILMAAAFLKTVAYVETGIGVALVEYCVFWVLVVGEFCIGAWVAIYRRNEWWAACFVFLLFFMFSLFQASHVLRGEADCGCLGGLAVSPLWMLVVDLLVSSYALAIAVENTGNSKRSRSWTSSDLDFLVFSTVIAIFTLFSLHSMSLMSKPMSIQAVRNAARSGMPILKPVVSIDGSLLNCRFDFDAIIGVENALQPGLFIRNILQKDPLRRFPCLEG